MSVRHHPHSAEDFASRSHYVSPLDDIIESSAEGGAPPLYLGPDPAFTSGHYGSPLPSYNPYDAFSRASSVSPGLHPISSQHASLSPFSSALRSRSHTLSVREHTPFSPLSSIDPTYESEPELTLGHHSYSRHASVPGSRAHTPFSRLSSIDPATTTYESEPEWTSGHHSYSRHASVPGSRAHTPFPSTTFEQPFADTEQTLPTSSKWAWPGTQTVGAWPSKKMRGGCR